MEKIGVNMSNKPGLPRKLRNGTYVCSYKCWAYNNNGRKYGFCNLDNKKLEKTDSGFIARCKL